MEVQLQIYLIIGIVAFFLAGLILAVSVMAYYLVKIYNKVSNQAKEHSYLRKHDASFKNPTLDLDDELSRRYTMHTLERSNLETFKNQTDDKRMANKESTKSHNVAKNSHGGSVIDVSEQFVMKRQNGNENSRYNSSIIMQVEDRRGTNTSIHELRTPFNEKDTF